MPFGPVGVVISWAKMFQSCSRIPEDPLSARDNLAISNEILWALEYGTGDDQDSLDANHEPKGGDVSMGGT